MNKFLKFFLSALLFLGAATQIGCASGGYKLTRQFAGFVNKQDTIIRIIVYIVTIPVFAITLLVDSVIFNTMDFWEGRVSANDYSFDQDGKHYLVQHYYDGKLRNTKITITDKAKVNTLRLSETKAGQVEVYENGLLKQTVSSISDVKTLTAADNAKMNQYISRSKVI